MSSLSSLRRPTRRTIFREHEVVATAIDIEMDGLSIPARTRCVVVHVHDAGSAYEVEFESPARVLTLSASQLKAAGSGAASFRQRISPVLLTSGSRWFKSRSES